MPLSLGGFCEIDDNLERVIFLLNILFDLPSIVAKRTHQGSDGSEKNQFNQSSNQAINEQRKKEK